MKICVFEFKVCSLQYFLDDMQPYELSIILESLDLTIKHDYEQTRFISYLLAQTHCTKKLKLQDIMSFPWDKESKANTSISNEDIDRLKRKAQEIINNKN